MGVVAQVTLNPDAGELVGSERFQSLANGIAGWALLGCLVGLVLAGVVVAFGNSTGNQYAARGGRTAVLSALLGALIIGGAAAFINFAFGVGQGI